jgi:hypothetical protein
MHDMCCRGLNDPESNNFLDADDNLCRALEDLQGYADEWQDSPMDDYNPINIVLREAFDSHEIDTEELDYLDSFRNKSVESSDSESESDWESVLDEEEEIRKFRDHAEVQQLITNHRTSRKNECRCLLKQLSPEEVQNRDISRVIRAIDHCRGLLRKKNRSGGNSTDTYIRDILRGFDNSLTVP